MNITNVWGQGQIFAFSAMDGAVSAENDFAGILSGDRIGIRFLTKTVRELAVILRDCNNLDYTAVTGDYIRFVINDECAVRIIYCKEHIIIGDVCEKAKPFVFIEGDAETYRVDNIIVHNTYDGDFTAFFKDSGRFVFAYGRSEEEAVRAVKEGICVDIDDAEKKKLDYYRKNAICANDEHERLYTKCLSVMKTQLYSPEGCMKHIWSTPDRVPHKHLWLWDSVFHSIGFLHISGALAEELILSIFSNQRDDGFIPHMASLNKSSTITQPPVIAWGAYKVYEKTGNVEFLKRVYECNSKFLSWCRDNRRKTEEELYVWHVSEDENCRCDESGMDNSPRFDNVKHLQAIDFSCFMANEARYMKKIGDILGNNTDEYERWYEEIRNDINKKLWDNDCRFYFDYDLDNDRINKVYSVASFLPLFTCVCDKEKAESLVKHLSDPEMFKTDFPIPSIAVKDGTFGSDMWRGPVWINYNYMISEGLEEYGFKALADEIRDKTIECVNKWYKETGTLFEYYDSENKAVPKVLNRKGTYLEPYNMNIRIQSVRDYGWSCTLVCDLLYKKYFKY